MTKQLRYVHSIFYCLVICVLFSQAKENKTDIQSKWQTHVIDKKGSNKICFATTQPASSTGDYKKRGAVYLTVSNRQQDNVMGEISIELGYSIKPDTDVTLVIDNAKTFQLFIKNETAWAYGDEDAKIIKALVAGKNATVTGISFRGTKTTDTFELKGFKKALDQINSSCTTRKSTKEKK